MEFYFGMVFGFILGVIFNMIFFRSEIFNETIRIPKPKIKFKK